VLNSLKSGLHRSVRVRSARAVKAQGDFSAAPRGFAEGVYFLSANLGRKGVATCAVSARFFRGGGGLIFAMGKVARSVSDFGVDVCPDVVAGWGIRQTTPGYAQSRVCVK
jgi:hypothetical protein